MRIFKSFVLTWWQGSIFKLALLSAGIAIGATWPYVFFTWTGLLWIFFIAGAAYLTYIWWKQ